MLVMMRDATQAEAEERRVQRSGIGRLVASLRVAEHWESGWSQLGTSAFSPPQRSPVSDPLLIRTLSIRSTSSARTCFLTHPETVVDTHESTLRLVSDQTYLSFLTVSFFTQALLWHIIRVSLIGMKWNAAFPFPTPISGLLDTLESYNACTLAGCKAHLHISPSAFQFPSIRRPVHFIRG